MGRLLLTTGILLAFFTTFSCSSPQKSTQEEQANLYYQHGTSKLISHEYTDALDNLIKAHQLNGKDSKICNNLGMAYYFKNELARAEFYLKKALDLDAKNSDARNNLASLYFERGLFDLAKKEYLKIKNDLVYKNQYRTYYNLAHISLKERKISEAIQNLNSSLKENFDYCPAHFLLGKIEFGQERYQKAYENFREASMGTCVNNPEPHYEQARCLIKLSRFNDAAEKLEYLIAKFPNDRLAVTATQTLNQIKSSNNSLTRRPSYEPNSFEMSESSNDFSTKENDENDEYFNSPQF
ncbi:MAG: hypothetical protein A2504_03950 [Bdellovibrionales bacterium RIFOXYD12_FULL_39_22]|nr:MAG: hypothetical protein A2385_11700 [Bdellovibrionales bacterium RIFOXYB1_FULL_39_21]OFZ41728.1 MAG: hypothetical protein A2485_02010 [Bdellovibrionales bacterium RIFOXYC12_FULL_39_17]OFZ46128.1 MAG: hypothetical protein A2404_12375 [Bdellovibrionales bacterium RIFOXYC1_FULL_39_130]OFZ72663.1 MAG: hypothetical protein A2451_09800 [Bdellovibrionales bacterium RIFOXYC2_FULL_39_8]OFZ74955.1 MAG: hypothetical protein A2560_15415 [Bdellovibrionales bacterium RIFOXYD1_FULL_39_84]OFZ92808.1 MAG: